MEELKIKDEYIGWSFEPNLQKVKNLFINGHEIDFKLITVKENCNDGKSSFDGIFSGCCFIYSNNMWFRIRN